MTAAQPKLLRDDSGPISRPLSLAELQHSLPRKLKTLAALRCAMVTLLFGSAIVVSLSETSPRQHLIPEALSTLILATYVLTLFFALGLKLRLPPLLLSHISFAYDAMLAAGLVLLTGHLESPFTYLFLIISMYGAILLGLYGGIAAACYACLGIVLVLFVSLDLLSLRPYVPIHVYPSPSYRALTLVFATAGVGALTGLLAQRLLSATSTLARSRRDIASLKDLNDRIVASLSSGLLTLDAEGKVLSANPAALSMLGIIGELDPSATLHALGLDRPLDSARKQWELDFERSDGAKLTLGLRATPLYDGLGADSGEIIVIDDLSELRKMQRAVEQRDRLSTLGRFAASVAHEIRNPLTSISGAIEMLSENIEKSSDDARLMAIVSMEIERLNLLLGDILDYARPRELRRVRLDLVELVNEAATLFSKDRQGAQLQFELELPSFAMCHADEASLRRVMLNLWRNAAEATESRGRILTRLSLRDSEWCLEVADDGPGIPEQQRELIFEPFFTTKDGGNGLGLATVHQLVSGNHGTIRVANPLEALGLCGACFELRLMASESGSFPKLELASLEPTQED